MADRLSLHRRSCRGEMRPSTQARYRSRPGVSPGPSPGTASPGPQWRMSVNADCRHYIMQTTGRGDKVERCRVEANENIPFACPEGCVFYEARKVSSAGWHV